MNTSMNSADSSDARVLVFSLGDDSFALPVSNVREIVTPQPITPVPNAPLLVPGLVNVRGGILPYFNLRERLGLPPVPEQTLGTRFIVYDAPQGGRLIRLAFDADSVDSVAELDAEGLADMPDMGTTLPPECLLGVHRNDQRMIIRLDQTEAFNAEFHGFSKFDKRTSA